MFYKLCRNDLKLLLASKIKPEAEDFNMSSSAYRQVVDWAANAQLLDDRGDLTVEGKLVATKDPHLETTVTEWLIHFNIGENDSLWSYFIHRFLPENPRFSYDDFTKSATQTLSINLSDAKNKASLMIENYLNSGAFSRINFLSQEDQLLSTGQSELSNRYTVGYLLAKTWKREFKQQATVTVDQILDSEVKLLSSLGINSSQLLEELDLLADAEIIEQRSARPSPVGRKTPIRQSSESFYQVYRCWDDPVELLEKAYENDIATPNRPLIQSLGDILKDDDDVSDFSQFLEWAVELPMFECSSLNRIRLAS